MNYSVKAIASLYLFFSASVQAEQHFSIDSLQYEGAFRLPIGTFGESRVGFANGTIAISSDNSSIYIVGHSQHQAIAEFAIPAISSASQVEELTIASRPIQPFYRFLDDIPNGREEDNIDRITGMAVINERLVVNAAEYYDGSADNIDTTFIVENPSDLENAIVSGFYRLEGKVKAGGWITWVPEEHQESIGAEYIFGNASNLAINGRLSMGPSAYAVDSYSLNNVGELETIPTEALLSYSIQNALHSDLYNRELSNDLWTELSKAYIGIIVPGTDTYLVLGTSAGHDSGIGYKITQDTGYQCGGPCSYVASDQYNYYWMYDVNDLLNAKNGEVALYDPLPFEYGKLDLPFSEIDGDLIPNIINGASYNERTGQVYLTMAGADSLQSSFESAPIILVFNLGVNRPKPPASFIMN